MTLGRKINFFLCYGTILGDSFRQEALDTYLTWNEKQKSRQPKGYEQWGKIQTIKWVRVQTAWGLRESKLFVDQILVDVGLLDKDYFRDKILRTQ
ncbi:hypothetical protein LCGC14_0810260 [marine sediment metagenome]|uniref:Uncharacterized protein n=1 Tax=marine sediment metagenome TaxID=412755 RepID=A0A0F9Q740_9ZZZZ